MKFYIIFSFLIIFAVESVKALNCNGCTFHQKDLTGAFNCNTSYTCENGVTSCETIVSKDDDEYLIVFGCGVGYCKDPKDLEAGLDKCSDNDNCFDCCEGDNCNSVANFAFDEETKVASDTDKENTDKPTTVAGNIVSQSTDSSISVTQKSDSSNSTSTLSADSVSMTSTAKSNLLDTISKIEDEQVKAKNEEAKDVETKNEDDENEDLENVEDKNGVKDFKDEDYEDAKDTIETTDDTTSKTASVSTDADKLETTTQNSKASLDVNKLTDELEEDGELAGEETHDSRGSVQDKFDDSKELIMQDEGTSVDKNLDNDSTSSTAGAEINNSTESTTTTVEPSSGSSLFIHFNVLFISIFIISLC